MTEEEEISSAVFIAGKDVLFISTDDRGRYVDKCLPDYTASQSTSRLSLRY
jgi:hypothetical protein